jgi:DNA polymerase III epsilon subunit-like protein
MNKYLVMDCEFTGLHAYKHGLTQLAALVVDTQFSVIKEFNQFVLPPAEVEIVPESMEISGITLEMLEEKGVSYSELCANFIHFIRSNFDEPPVVIGQFLPADYSFLDKVFSENMPDKSLQFFEDILSRNFIDTKSLANILNMKAETQNRSKVFIKTSLSKPGGLKDVLGVDPAKYQAHDALEDCKANLEILQKMLELFEIK